MQYVTQWQFWVAVVVVALAVNFVWEKFTGGGPAV